MDSEPNSYIETLKIITGFLSENLWPIVFIVFILCFKTALIDLINRLVKLNVKQGDNEIGIEATAPQQENKVDTKPLNAAEKPVIKEQNSVEPEVEDAEGKSWFGEMFKALDEKNVEDAKKIFEAHKAESNEDKLVSNTALFLYLRFSRAHDDSAIEELELLVQHTKSENSKYDALTWLGLCYHLKNQNTKELNLWEQAVKEFSSEELITKSTVELANSLNKAKESVKAKELLLNRLSSVQDENQKSIIYFAISETECLLGNKKISIYCKDKALEFDTNNKDKLFETAYEASNESIDEISVLNYISLLRIDEDNSTARNNLGVCAQEAGLKIKAVENYQSSTQLENTLAMANQGYLLLEAGFINEAKELADNAIQAGEPHENIYSLQTSISEKRKEQNKKWVELVDKAKERQKLIRNYTEQYYLGESDDLAGTWYLNNGSEIEFKLSEERVLASWCESINSIGSVSKVSYDIEVEGQVSGSTFIGRYRKVKQQGQQETLFTLTSNQDFKCIGFVSEKGDSLSIISESIKDGLNIKLTRTLA